MEAVSTGELVRAVGEEGRRITRKCLEGLIATGRVQAPLLVGPMHVWMPEDVAHVRRVLVALDGEPEKRGGGKR